MPLLVLLPFPISGSWGFNLFLQKGGRIFLLVVASNFVFLTTEHITTLKVMVPVLLGLIVRLFWLSNALLSRW